MNVEIRRIEPARFYASDFTGPATLTLEVPMRCIEEAVRQYLAEQGEALEGSWELGRCTSEYASKPEHVAITLYEVRP